MTVLTYPSENFPAPVPLEIEILDGWEPLTVVGVQLGALRPAPNGQFAANVIVEVSRFGGAYTLKQAVDLAQRNANAAKRYRYTRREGATVAGVDGYILDGVFPAPKGGALLQTVRLAVIPRGPVVDLVQVTGTCSQAQEGPIWDDVRAVADSIRAV